MQCVYCRYSNSAEDHRCRRCGRRLDSARPAPDTYPAAERATSIGFPSTGAAALKPRVFTMPEPPAPAADPLGPAPAVPGRQQALFADEPGRVVPFPPRAARPAPAEPRPRRRPLPPPDPNQPSLNFLPVAPNAPRTLGTSVEAVIFCDAPVATPMHRAVASALDIAIVFMGWGIFAFSYYLFGGDFVVSPETLPWFAASFLLVALFYGFTFALACSETPGARWAGLRLINFDGFPIGRKERFLRYLSACLSFASGGLGLLWALADEESLTWHDHISKSFPTFRS